MTTASGPDTDSGLRTWLPSFLTLAVIWGSSFLLIKVGVRELHPLYLTLGRVAAGALTLLAILAATRGRLPRDPRLWGHLSVVAAIGVALPFTLFGFGEQRVSSVLAGIWNAATPLVALPLAVVAFRTERMTVRRAVGIAIGFAGVLVVLGVWRDIGGSQLTGQLMCFGAAMCYAVAIPYQKRFITGRAGSGLSMSAAQLLLATGQLAIVAPLFAGRPPAVTGLSTDVLLAVLALGALGTGVAFVLNFRVVRFAGASTSASVTYLMPIVATIIGVGVLHERLVWNQPVGALVVLCGVAVSQGLLGRPRTTEPGTTRRRSPAPAGAAPDAVPDAGTASVQDPGASPAAVGGAAIGPVGAVEAERSPAVGVQARSGRAG